MKEIILALSVLLALSGCKSKHTVSWWKQHDAERKPFVAMCRDDNAKMKTDTDCQNAVQAEDEKRYIGEPGNNSVPDPTK